MKNLFVFFILAALSSLALEAGKRLTAAPKNLPCRQAPITITVQGKTQQAIATECPTGTDKKTWVLRDITDGNGNVIAMQDKNNSTQNDEVTLTTPATSFTAVQPILKTAP